jgi:hypothetical protein
MSRATSCLLPFVCLLAVHSSLAQDPNVYPGDDPPTTSLNSETANNTSACLAAGNPSYCTEALQASVTTTSSGNQAAGAQTLVVDALPEHVSTLSLHRYINQGAPWTNGQLICEYQPWFSTNSGTNYNGHSDIGYDENGTSTVANQDTKMISRGCNINLVDFYGNVNQDSTHQFNLTTTNKVYADLWPRTNVPLKLGILEDQGSFDATASGYCGDPTLTESATISCIEAALETDMRYIYQNYIFFHPSAIWTDGGKNVIGYFGGCGTFAALNNINLPGHCDHTNPNDDWNQIWNVVKGYVDSQGYNMKFIFQYGYFGYPTISAGEYAWPQPASDTIDNNNDGFQDNPTSQWWWCDPNGYVCDGTGQFGAYLDRFYIDGSNNLSNLTIGLLYSGFDDSNAIPWGKDKVIAQQCGHVLSLSANEVNKGGYWGTTHQIPYMMLATWNDYEEGSEQESGIDNCYTAVNLSFQTGSNTKVQWSLTVDPHSQGYQGTDTIHHYAVWTSTDNGTTLTLRGQPKPPITTFDLGPFHLGSGAQIYVEMVGQPSIQNEMSNHVTTQ